MAARGGFATALRGVRPAAVRYAAARAAVVRPRAAALALGGAGRVLVGIAGRQARSFHATAAQNSSFGGGGGDSSWHMGVIVVPQQMAYVSPARAQPSRVRASTRARARARVRFACLRVRFLSRAARSRSEPPHARPCNCAC